MKPCDNCSPMAPETERVCIGNHHLEISPLRQFLGVALIYLPIAFLPLVVLSALITYWHLRLMGARNLKTLKDYLPARESYRYKLANQITMEPGYAVSPTQTRLFWILNCTWYCPYSVAIFDWHAYLVKVVENWWCPFRHGRKETAYRSGAIDRSLWHVYPSDVAKLDPEDRDNPIWNEGSDGKERRGPADR